VVINKVFPDKVEEIWRTTATSLKNKGVDVLGVIPYDKMLSYPTLEHIINEVPDFKPLTEVSEEVQKTPINSIIIGAMTPHEALKYFKGRELIITGGDREDIIASALCQTAIQQQTKKGGNILGIIATGGLKPHDSLLNTAENIGVMVMQAEEDTFTVASKVKDMTIKLRPKNVGKINKLKMIIKKYVNTDKLLNGQ
ncbi:MAG: DRTGG domain-containing protein, partial [Halanaerobiaceae bacterium]